MEDPRLEANALVPTNSERDPASSRTTLPIPWISPDAVPEVPLVHMPPPRLR
jgi:hypothetical protein